MTLRAGVLVLALLSAAVVASGCGTASDPSPPAGVDELVIPTPSPDPDDFVATVDNPWLPLTPGRSWTYEVADTDGTHRMRVRVEAGPTIAGVATTARVSVEPGARVTDYFAQDTAGNVWWFGRRGGWQAGTAGAEAGLAMPASPRVGDGFRTAYADGVVEDTAVVRATGERVTVPAGTFNVLVLEERSDLEPGRSVESSYGEGVGLVARTVTAGGYRAVRLVSATGSAA